jgi:hypothetical protein
MYSQFHQEFAKAYPSAADRNRRAYERPGRGQPPPGRLRGGAAYALASAAQRLDRERARRVL